MLPVYMVFWKILNSFWQHHYAFGQIFMILNGLILNNYFDI